MSRDTESDITLNTPPPVATALREHAWPESGHIRVPVALLRPDITALLGLDEFVFLIHLFAFPGYRPPVFSASPASLSVSLGLPPEFIQNSIARLEASGLIARVSPSGRGPSDERDLSPLLRRMRSLPVQPVASLHTCPRCGEVASSPSAAERLFGFRRTHTGKKIIQSWCKTCRHRQAVIRRNTP